MKLSQARRGQPSASERPWPLAGEGTAGQTLDLIASAGERVFAAGLTLLITADVAAGSLDLSLPAKVREAGENLLVVLVVLGAAVALARGRHDGGPMGVSWWQALPLFVFLLALALRADVPVVYRITVIVGGAAFVVGLLWGTTPNQQTMSRGRAASRFHLAIAAAALALVAALHGAERTTLVSATELVAGAYLILLAPGIQVTYLLLGEATAALERLGWGVALSMAIVPLALMWLIWLGVSPTREAVLVAVAVLIAVSAGVVNLLPDRSRA